MRSGDSKFFACLCGVSILAGLLMMTAALSGCKDGHVKRAKAEVMDVGRIEDIEAQHRRTVVVAVKCPEGKGQSGVGSGVIISEHTVLSASHVVSCDDAQVWVVMPDGTARHMTLIDRLESHDLILMASATAMTVDAHKVKGGFAREGDTVCVVPGTPKKVRECGEVIAVFKRPGIKNLYFAAASEAGNSGSGIYNLEGEIVGILTHSTNKGGAGTALWLMDPRK